MTLEEKNMRYAHSAGHTDICFASDMRNLLTCGSDGYVRIWEGSDDEDPSAEVVAERNFAIACSNNQFFVATNNNYVQAFSYPERIKDKIVLRFSAPVTHIAISSSGKFLAACSCDMEVQVINNETNKITTFSGHTAPVLGVSLDPLDEFVVSSSCDGTVKVWNIANGSLVKTFTDFVQIKNDFFKAICLTRTAWKSSSGSLLAIPKDFEVITFKRDTWEIAYKLVTNKIEQPLSVVLFSPCGSYVAAASTGGDIVIWEVKHKSEICHFKDPKKVGICGIVWNPDGSEIAFTDRLGRLGVLPRIDEEIGKHEIQEENKRIEEGKVADESNEIRNIIDANDLFDDEDDENCISLEKIKAPYKNASDEEETPGSPASTTSHKTGKEPIIPLTKAQPSFQPSSTPPHFEPRCLCFNSIGIIRYYDSDKTIDVQFHDTMFHHALFLRSFGVCTMATVSTSVLCLAVPSLDENFSKLSCIPLSSWAGNKEWTVYMPENEDIVALAAGGSWVTVATNANFLRIFTHAGTQKQIISLPGPVVCMSGYEQKIFIVCHMGMGLLENQSLGFIIYHISNLCVRAITPFQPLPLFPNSILKWIGFTDEGTPCTFDSEGILRLLGHDLLHWSVVCDTRNQKKSSADNYFIIGLSENYQNVRCILCRNSVYPLVVNTPTVLEIPLKVPLCALDAEKSIQEEIFWRLMFSLHSLEKISVEKSEYLTELTRVEKSLKEAALKLFADACRNSEDLRALDVATFMSSHPLEVAVKYASKVGKMYLAEKLNGINPVDWRDQYPHIENSAAAYSLRNYGTETAFSDNADKTIYSQQDLFEDFPDNAENGKKPADCAKRPADQSVLTETRRQTLANPFKKVQVQQQGTPKGLQFFDTLAKETPQTVNKVQIKNKVLKLKPLNTTKDKETESKAKKPSFVQWFSTQKAVLSEEYPNISATELTKLGMKKFKEEMSMISAKDKTDGADSNLTESKKRGPDEENEPEAKRSKNFDESA